MSRIYDEDAILDDLPLGLRKEMQVELFIDVVQAVPLFMRLSDMTLQEICNRLQPVYQTTGLQITSEGEVPDALYIVRFGVVSVLVDGDVVMEAKQGDMIGENAVMGLTSNGRRNRSCVAKTSCELCRLTAKDFVELLRSCHDLQLRLRTLVHTHLRDLEEGINMSVAPSIRDRYCVDWIHVGEKVDAENDEYYRKSGQKKKSSIAGSFKNVFMTIRKLKEPTSKDTLGQVKSDSPHASQHGNSETQDSTKSIKGMLTTRMQLQVRALLPAADAALNRFHAFERVKYAVIAVQYPGTQDCPGSLERSFSDVFRIEQDIQGTILLDQHISIEVRHLINDWCDTHLHICTTWTAP